MVNQLVRYVDDHGHPTLAWLQEAEALAADNTALTARVAALEALLTDIAAVTAPAGGSTVDAEARTAIAAIISAAS